MPTKSARQFRFMQAAAHGKGMSGIAPGTAQEFLDKTPEDKKKKFAKAYKKNK